MLQSLLFRSDVQSDVKTDEGSDGKEGAEGEKRQTHLADEEEVARGSFGRAIDCVEDKKKLRGAQKRKPTVIRRYVREEVRERSRKAEGLILLNGFGGGVVSGSDAMTLTAEDVFKASELELPGGMNGHVGWGVGTLPRNLHGGDEGMRTEGEFANPRRHSGQQMIQLGLGVSPRKLYDGEQSEAFDLSCKNNTRQETFVEEGFVAPEVLLEEEASEESAGTSPWEDPRQREALGDFVYAAAVASHGGVGGGWKRIEEEDGGDLENVYESCEGVEEQMTNSISGIPFPGENGGQYCVSIPTEPERFHYNPRSVVTSSEDVLDTNGFTNHEFQEEVGGEPSSTSWTFVEPTPLPFKPQGFGQMPLLQISARHLELPQQVSQKRPRGRPRQTPLIQLGGASEVVSTTVRPNPRRGRPRGSGGQKLSEAFCGSKTCVDHEEQTKRLKEDRRVAAKAMRELEKSKRVECATEMATDGNACRPGEFPEDLQGEEERDGGRRSKGFKKPKQIRYRTERPFSCPHCPGSFTLRSNMERHGKQQHPSLWMPSPSVRHQRRKNEPQKTTFGLYWDENTTQY